MAGGGTTGGGGTHLGPGLAPGMGEAEAFGRLNAWGVARDGELVDLRASLASTQAAVGATFNEARGALMTIVNDFRMEAETMRNHGLYEATQNLERLNLVVSEARARFDAQDAGHTADLSELARRIAAAAPAPQAAAFRAAPAPALVTSPGGTHRFYPGGPADGVVVQVVPAAGFTTPQRPAQQQQPQPTPTTTHDAWGPWAAGRGAAPPIPVPFAQCVPDAWAAAAFAPTAAPQQPGGEPQRHSYMNSPGMDGGRPREMRLDARGWANNQPKLDIGVANDVFQIWKDRAMSFLSHERPDVRKLLSWAETCNKEALQTGLATQPRTSASSTWPTSSTHFMMGSK